MYLNCILIASGDQVLPNDLFKDQILSLGKEKLNAELTEFRFWSTALSLNEIKDQHRMPLEIVYEKKKEMKFKFKKVDKSAQVTTYSIHCKANIFREIHWVHSASLEKVS